MHYLWKCFSQVNADWFQQRSGAQVFDHLDRCSIVSLNNGGFFCPTCKRKFRVAVYARFKLLIATHTVTLIYCHKAVRVEDWATVLDLKWVGILLLGARGDEKQLRNSDSPVLFLENGDSPIWFSIIPPMFFTVGR